MRLQSSHFSRNAIRSVDVLCSICRKACARPVIGAAALSASRAAPATLGAPKSARGGVPRPRCNRGVRRRSCSPTRARGLGGFTHLGRTGRSFGLRLPLRLGPRLARSLSLRLCLGFGGGLSQRALITWQEWAWRIIDHTAQDSRSLGSTHTMHSLLPCKTGHSSACSAPKPIIRTPRKEVQPVSAYSTRSREAHSPPCCPRPVGGRHALPGWTALRPGNN